MAGTIVADDLQHSTAGSVGTEYVVNGSAKAWLHWNGIGTISLDDSFNCTSLTDLGTGQGQIDWISAMSSVNVACTESSSYSALTTSRDRASSMTATTTTRAYHNTYVASSGAATDNGENSGTVHGDLA